MSGNLTYAVIGAGNMGRNHIRTILQISNLSLVGVSDICKETRDSVSSEFGIELYEDYEDMIKNKKPDLASICVPTKFHYKVALYCMQAGVHVLLEKPIASSLEEGNSLLAEAKKHGVKLLVGHVERFNPALKKVKEMVQNGDLGKVIAVIARRVGGFPPQIKDSDVAVDLAVHDIDIVNYLLGELPNHVIINKQRNHVEQRDDSVEFFLKYKQSSAYIQANWITPVKIRNLAITGSEGYLEMDYINQKIEFYKSNYDKFKEKQSDFSDYILRFSEPDKILISIAKKEPLKEEIIYFVNCINNNVDIDSQYSVDALKIALST